MSKEKKLHQDLENAIKWAGAEHYYFKELKEDLVKLRVAVEEALTDQTISGIQEAFRTAKKLMKTENRLQYFVAHSESLAKAMKEKILQQARVRQIQQEAEKYEEVLHRIDIEAAPLILDASRYDCRIKDLLEHLEKKVSHENPSENDLPQAHQIVMELYEVIDEAERWLAALAFDLEKAKKLSEEFAEGYHESIEGVQAALAPLSDEAKGEYVAYLLSHGKGLSEEVREWLKNYITEKGGEFYGERIVSSLSIQSPIIKGAGKAQDKYGYYNELEQERKTSYGFLFQSFPLATKTKNLPWLMQLLRKINFKWNYSYEKDETVKKALDTATKLAWKQRSRKLLLELAGLYLQCGTGDAIIKVKEIYEPLEEWEKLAEVCEKYFNNFPNAAQFYEKAGNFAKAKECYKKFAERELRSPRRNLRKILSALQKAGYSKKEAYLQCAEWSGGIEIGKTNAAKFYELAEEWLLAAKVWKNCYEEKKAEKCLQKAEKFRLSKSKKQKNLAEQGDIYFENGNYQKALEFYERAEAWRKIGDALNKLGRGVEALKAYKKAKEQEAVEAEIEEQKQEVEEIKKKVRQGQTI